MVGVNKDCDSRRAYQCIKLVVALSARCPVARDHLTRTQARWQWAVEWLKEKMDDHSATLSAAMGLSNEDSNTKNFQRTTSAQVLRDQWYMMDAMIAGYNTEVNKNTIRSVTYSYVFARKG